MMDDEDEDVFHILLNEHERTKQTKSAVSKEKCDDDNYPFKLNYSVHPLSPQTLKQADLESHILESIYNQGLTVLDHCKDRNFHYVLVDNSYNLAVVQVFALDNDNTQKPKLSTILQTSLKSSLFKGVERSVVRHVYVIHGDDSLDAPPDPSTVCVNAGYVHLPTPSFASIFGKPTSLTKSPVIVLCTNDGCVFWRPFKSLNGGERFCVMCQLHSFVNSIASVPVCKISDVDEDVARVLKKALAADDARSDGSGNSVIGLLAVCDIGECCLMLPMTKQNNSCEYFPVRFCLPHPVICCVKRGNQIIYSTGSTVEAVTLTTRDKVEAVTLTTRDKVEAVTLTTRDKENQPSILLENCDTLMEAKIEQLSFQSSQKDSDPDVMGLTFDHDVIPIPTASASHTTHSAFTTAIHHLPESIQSINQHSVSIQTLQKTSDVLDSHLLQLNLFASLYRQHQLSDSASNQRSFTVNNQNSKEQLTPLIDCKCYLDHSQGYRKGSEVRVQLRNDSKVDLSAQWSVLVITVPQTYAKVCANNFCFKIEGGFPSDCKKTFSVPVPEALSSDHIAQLRIRVCLVLSFEQYSCERLTEILTTIKPRDLLDVEIHNQIFNSLDFLRISSDDDMSVSKVTGCYSSEEIRSFLDRLAEKKIKKKRSQNMDCKLKKNVAKMTVPDLADSKLEPTEEVLGKLFHIIKHFPNVSNSLLCQSLNGTNISFTLEKIESQTDKGTQRLQMKIESSDFLLLSTVHCALLEKFELWLGFISMDSNSCRQNSLILQDMPMKLFLGMSKKTLHATVSKMELEKQLSALKSIRSHLSRPRNDDMASNLCEALDCLGEC